MQAMFMPLARPFSYFIAHYITLAGDVSVSGQMFFVFPDYSLKFQHSSPFSMVRGLS